MPLFMGFSCGDCSQRFVMQKSLHKHQKAQNHISPAVVTGALCSDCGRCLGHELALRQHLKDKHGHGQPTDSQVTEFRCCDCDRAFNSELALDHHMKFKKVHKPTNILQQRVKGEHQTLSDTSPECRKCRKTFKTESAKQQHLNSLRHKPLSKIKCLASDSCNGTFNSPSAQIQHLESGRCKSGMTKAKLNAAIVANDPDNIITTSKGKSLTAESLAGCESGLSSPTSSLTTSPTASPILTPSSSEYFDSYPPSGAVTPTGLETSSTSVVPIMALGRQKCPLCPSTRTRTFAPFALRDHLASSVHRHHRTTQQLPDLTSMSGPVPIQIPMSSKLMPNPKEEEVTFHCPTALLVLSSTKKKIHREFATVSALAQHLESGACNGGSDAFKLIAVYVQQELKRLGFGGLYLLQ